MKKRAKHFEPLSLTFGYQDRAKLLSFPWPWAKNSVAEFTCVDVFQYVARGERVEFMEELYRVLQDGAKAHFQVFYYSTMLAYGDTEVEWPPLNEMSFMYFSKSWREANQVPTKIDCDFDLNFNYSVPPEVAGRASEVQSHQIKSDLNTVVRLQVSLTKNPRSTP